MKNKISNPLKAELKLISNLFNQLENSKKESDIIINKSKHHKEYSNTESFEQKISNNSKLPVLNKPQLALNRNNIQKFTYKEFINLLIPLVKKLKK